MTKSVAGELAGLELPVERGCPFAPPATYEQLREQAPINKIRMTSGGQAWWVSALEARSFQDRQDRQDRDRVVGARV